MGIFLLLDLLRNKSRGPFFGASLKSSDYYWPEPEPLTLRATGQVSTIVVSIEFSPLSTVELTTNWYQLHNGDYKGKLHDICIQIRTIQLLIFTEKFSPLSGFEPGPPWYQADMLPIELSWLGW